MAETSLDQKPLGKLQLSDFSVSHSSEGYCGRKMYRIVSPQTLIPSISDAMASCSSNPVNTLLRSTKEGAVSSLRELLKGSFSKKESSYKLQLFETELLNRHETKQPLLVSEFLRDCGFSFKSQSNLISSKLVGVQTVQYLISLFFEPINYPCNRLLLNSKTFDRLSNKWGVIQTILQKIDPSISAESVVYSLLKSGGCAYESLILFLDIFEYSYSRKEKPCDHVYALVDDSTSITSSSPSDTSFSTSLPDPELSLILPVSSSKFLTNLLKSAQFSWKGMEAFVSTFVARGESDKTEWKQMVSSLSINLFRIAQLDYSLLGFNLRFKDTDYVVVDDVKTLTMRRLVAEKNDEKDVFQLFVVDFAKEEVLFQNKDESFDRLLDTPVYVRDPNITEAYMFDCFGRCMSFCGASNNKKALMTSFTECIPGLRFSTLFEFLCSSRGGGFVLMDAFKLIVKLISSVGSFKCKQALIDCFFKRIRLPDVGKVNLINWLCSRHGGLFSAKDAIKILVGVMSHDGGSMNFTVFLESLVKPLDILGVGKMTLFSFLCSDKGGKLEPAEAINALVRCVGNHGGSRNKDALVECFVKEIDISKFSLSSLFMFLKSPIGGNFSSVESVHLLLKCIARSGGAKNKVALNEFVLKKMKFSHIGYLSFFNCLVSPLGGSMSKKQALELMFYYLSSKNGVANKLALMSCFSDKFTVPGIGELTLFECLRSVDIGNLSSSESMKILLDCISTKDGERNKMFLISCLSSNLIEGKGKVCSLFSCLKFYGMSSKQAFYLCLLLLKNRSFLDRSYLSSLFVNTKARSGMNTVAKQLTDMGLSCYELVLKLFFSISRDSSKTISVKKNDFFQICRTLPSVFVDSDSKYLLFLNRHDVRMHRDQFKACVVSVFLDPFKMLNASYDLIVYKILDWVRVYNPDYELSPKLGLCAFQCNSIEDFLIILQLSQKIVVFHDQELQTVQLCETVFENCFKIFTLNGFSVFHFFSKYYPKLLSNFGFDQILDCFLSCGQSISSESLSYYFENDLSIDSCMKDISHSQSFLVYMQFSSVVSTKDLPISVGALFLFFDILRNLNLDIKNLCVNLKDELCAMYYCFSKLSKSSRNAFFPVMCKSIPKFFGSFSDFRKFFAGLILQKDWSMLGLLLLKLDAGHVSISLPEFRFLCALGCSFLPHTTFSWDDFLCMENRLESCVIVNSTGYPHWSFGLAYLQKLRLMLHLDYALSYCRHSDFFEIVLSENRRFVFSIELGDDGLVFKNKCIKDFIDFYTDSGLYSGALSLRNSVATVKNKNKRAATEEMYHLPDIPDKKKFRFVESDTLSLGDSVDLSSTTVRNKRKRVDTEEDLSTLPDKKMIRCMESDIKRLYKKVMDAQSMLASECEIFMNFSYYLTDSMIVDLQKKTVSFDGNEEPIFYRWRLFLKQYHEKTFDDVLMGDEPSFDLFNQHDLHLNSLSSYSVDDLFSSLSNSEFLKEWETEFFETFGDDKPVLDKEPYDVGLMDK